MGLGGCAAWELQLGIMATLLRRVRLLGTGLRDVDDALSRRVQ